VGSVQTCTEGLVGHSCSPQTLVFMSKTDISELIRYKNPKFFVYLGTRLPIFTGLPSFLNSNYGIVV
jgi:hypothetical protein